MMNIEESKIQIQYSIFIIRYYLLAAVYEKNNCFTALSADHS